MSTLDKILNRAKRGSVDDDDTNYVTVVDRPPSTYSYQKKTIPSRYTNDFERIYQVVKSSYNCGTVQYNYGTCYYDNLVQNYVQKGEAIVSSIQGYSNVSLQDLPLACNIPSMVYNTCSPPTNMLTTELDNTGVNGNRGFRLLMDGLYLYPDPTQTKLIFIENGFNNYRAEFILEKKSIYELDKIITPDKPYYEKYIKYKDDYKNANLSWKNWYNNIYELKYFYYIKHAETGKYLVPYYTVKYIKANRINFTYINRNVSYIIRIYDQNLDEIFIYNYDNNSYINRTGISTIIERINQGYVNIEFSGQINIGDIKISDKNNPALFYNFTIVLFTPTQLLINNVISIENSNVLPYQDIDVKLETNKHDYYSKVIAEYFGGYNFKDSNIYPILFPFETNNVFELNKNLNNISIQIFDSSNPFWYYTIYPTKSKAAFIIDKNTIKLEYSPNILYKYPSFKYSQFGYGYNGDLNSSFTKLCVSDDLKINIVYIENFYDLRYNIITQKSISIPNKNFYISKDYGKNFLLIPSSEYIIQINLSRDGKYAVIITCDNYDNFYDINISKSYYVKLYDINTGSTNLLKTFDSRVFKMCQSYDGNVIYFCLSNKKFWKCLNKKTFIQLQDLPFDTSRYDRVNYSSYINFIDTDYIGKNVIFNGNISTRECYISRNYGQNFTKYTFEYSPSKTTVRTFGNDFFIPQSTSLIKIDKNDNRTVIFRDGTYGRQPGDDTAGLIIRNITNNFILVSIYQDKSYLINKNTLNITYIGNYNGSSQEFISITLSNFLSYTWDLSYFNTNIPSSQLDTIYTLNYGLCYPSYSFSTNTISNQGVKNVFNANTFVLSTNTTTIKKISNNLYITSSSILRDDISLQIPSISGYIRDIACSNDGNFIIAAVYNGKLLVSTNGSSFTEYQEAGRLTGNTSSSSITNITRYWTSVACSFNGKYMSACAYNGNIFISINSGSLFTSLPENFAKKWVQIVMSKSSDDTKDGIIQLACAEDGLFISYDRGANWSQISNEVIDNALGNNILKWSSVAISDSGQYMLSTVYGGNVYASYNYGYDWSIYGVSRKECYEPVIFPTNNIVLPYLGYTVSASTTLNGNIISAFMDDTNTWSPSVSDNNINVIINIPYNFLLTDINIVNLTSVDVKITVQASNDGSNWTSIGENLNLYSTVDTNTSYSSFRLTFSSSNIQIQRIKLLGKTDFVSGGFMSQIGNWESCAIVSETQHYAAIDSGTNAGLYRTDLSTSFGNVITITGTTIASDTRVTVFDKQNNVLSSTVGNSEIVFDREYDFGRIETSLNTNGNVTIFKTVGSTRIPVFTRRNVPLSRVFFWF